MMGTVSVQSFKIAKGLPSENDTVSSNILTFLFSNLREKNSHFFAVCCSEILISIVLYFITTESLM